jgi:hypothetical protein
MPSGTTKTNFLPPAQSLGRQPGLEAKFNFTIFN